MEVYGLMLTAFSVLLLLSLVSFDPRDVALDYRLRSGLVHNLIGPVGAHIGDLLYRTVGLGAFVGCSTFFYFGGLLLAGRRPTIHGAGVTAYLLVLTFSCVICHLLLGDFRPFAHTPGGLTGEWVGEILRTLFATTGTIIIALSTIAASILTLSGLRIVEVARLPYRGLIWARDWVDGRRKATQEGTDEEPSSELPVTRAKDTRPVGKVGRAPILRDSWAPSPDEPSANDVAETDPAGPRARVVDAAPGPKLVEPETPEAAPKKKAKPATKKPETKPADDVQIDEKVAAEPVIEPMAPAEQPKVKPAQDSLPLPGPRPFEFPSLSLLDYQPPEHNTVDKDALQQLAGKLEEKLADFGIKGKVVRIQPGPVVTVFEFLPAAGVKISKIKNMADDLTMALEAQRVRIVAPIPGKGVVGIEVPSAVRETVYLKEILASDLFQNTDMKLPIALGKDIVGHPQIADLAGMPHVLVAGSTGSGKSVAINAFICSLIYKQKPRDLRLILVDPKMLELSIYDDIPHLLLPVVTQPEKATLALKWAVAEMERRYALMAACQVRNIAGFNKKVKSFASGAKKPPEGVAEDELEHLPYIVIILDELADLMMVAGKAVEQSIARLAQMARAAGLHLVVATQRPSVDVVTGLIKANFPTRMSFMVSQRVDSRTILDRQGAENLLGRGDMLYLPPGTSKLARVQGCWVSDGELERITDHLKAFGPPEYDMTILLDDDEDSKDLSGEKYDQHFDAAVAIVTETRKPSISYLQRRLSIGYNRAAKIIERMEFDGIVGKADHRGVRKVLAPPPGPPLEDE